MRNYGMLEFIPPWNPLTNIQRNLGCQTFLILLVVLFHQTGGHVLPDQKINQIHYSDPVNQEVVSKGFMNPEQLKWTSDFFHLLLRESTRNTRTKRGFFDKAHEKQKLEEEYDRSFRLFWFLGGVAIVFFILIFVLSLLFYLECFCCPNFSRRKRKDRENQPSIPIVSAPSPEPIMSNDFGMYSSMIEPRLRSPSVFSGNAHYVSHYRLSQEQVNTIQLQSQSRRNSYLPPISGTSVPPSPAPPLESHPPGILTSGLIDVSVIQEHRPSMDIIIA